MPQVYSCYGISYVVAPDQAMSPRPLLELLGRELGIKRLLVEGGGNVNGSLLAAGVIDEVSLWGARRSRRGSFTCGTRKRRAERGAR